LPNLELITGKKLLRAMMVARLLQMSNSADPNTILEIARTVASLGLSTSLMVILAWQSPKLLQVFLNFIRNLIKDFRTPSKERPARTQQSEKVLLEK
jgi:HD-like signal output (HDOD) protein